MKLNLNRLFVAFLANTLLLWYRLLLSRQLSRLRCADVHKTQAHQVGDRIS